MLARELVILLTSAEQPRTHSAAICLLKAVRDSPATVGDLETECDIAPNTVYSLSDPLVEAGFVDRKNRSFELTGAGAMALHRYMCLDTLERTALTKLPTTLSRRRLLDCLADQPATKSELDERCRELSYSAIQQALPQLENRDIVCENPCRQYELTESGIRALETESHLIDSLETILEYAVALRHFAPECANFPLRTLDKTRLFIATRDRPRIVRNEYASFLRDLDPAGPTHFRLFSAYYDHDMGKLYDRFLDNGAQIDIISPQWALNSIPTSRCEATQVQKALEADNCSWQLCTGDMPIGLTLIDDEYALFYPRRPDPRTGGSAMFRSEDETVIKWAHELFATYEANAKPPMRQLLATIINIGENESMGENPPIQQLLTKIRSL